MVLLLNTSTGKLKHYYVQIIYCKNKVKIIIEKKIIDYYALLHYIIAVREGVLQ